MGNYLADRRKELELTMKQVAEAVGVSEGTVSRWESGAIANMKRDKIYALAKVLKVTPTFVMTGEKENSQSQGSGTTSSEKTEKKAETDEDYLDEDIRRIARAHRQMSEKDRQRLMTIVTTSFDEYFSDDFEDDDTDA